MGERDEALRRAQQTLRRLQHEVRTPISQIIGYAELLEEELADRGAEDLAPDLHKIRHAAERLLDLADGRLRDEQDPGAPALTAEAVEPEAAELEAHAARALGREGRAHILVVDADANDRELLARRLERAGFRVETARDGLEALRRIDADEPDLVLLEVVMGDMSGLEVLERVRRKRSRAELPVVLATVLSGSEDVVEGLERGANDYVSKPFQLPVVVARVHAQLDAHRTARQVSELARQLEFRSAFIRQAFGRDVSDALLVEMAERPDAVDLGREARRVFALVADVRGSRGRAAELSPAQHTAVLRQVLSGLTEVATRYEGVVDAVLGDALVVLFGLPLPRGDDAERAVACAVAMQLEMDAVAERCRRVKLPAVEIGVGVAAGSVVVVGVGSGDQIKFKAVGEASVRAAQIEGGARPGEVWICPDTHAAVAPLVSSDRERELRVPGLAAPLRLYRVLGVGGAQLVSLRAAPADREPAG
jgi:class 3 adenylate cyclase/CheY-like chemotaxis protein